MHHLSVSPGARQLADVLTKDLGPAADTWRGHCDARSYTLADEQGSDDDAETAGAGHRVLTYWHNARTGESRWKEPRWKKKRGASRAAARAGDPSRQQDQLVTQPQALPDGWEECVDEEGRVFYHHVPSGESIWERPA